MARFPSLTLLTLAAALLVSSACDRDRAPAPVAADMPIALDVAGRTNLGPSGAAFGKLVAVVWTASTDSVSDIYVAISRDSGATFSPPSRVNHLEGDARASGEQPARLVIGHGPIIHVVWPTRQDGVSQIRYASSSDLGKSFPAANAGADATTAATKTARSRGQLKQWSMQFSPILIE